MTDVKMNAEVSATSKIHHVRPSDIKIEHASRNPRYKPHTNEELRALALRFLADAKIERGRVISGQQNAGTAGKDENGDLLLLTGHGRLAACDMISDLGPTDADFAPHLERLGLVADGEWTDPSADFWPFLVRIMPLGSDDARFEQRISENADRKDMSPMDWSVVCADLRKRPATDPDRAAAGDVMSYQDIADWLKPYAPTRKATVSPSWVNQMLDLADASPAVGAAVHNRQISVHTGVTFVRESRRLQIKDESAEGGVRPPTLQERHAWMDEKISAVSTAGADSSDEGDENEGSEVDRKAATEALRAERAKRGTKTTKTLAEVRRVCAKSVEACNSRVARAIEDFIGSKIDETAFLSILADSAEEPAEDKAANNKANGKRGSTSKPASPDPAVNKPPKKGEHSKGKKGKKSGGKKGSKKTAPPDEGDE